MIIDRTKLLLLGLTLCLGISISCSKEALTLSDVIEEELSSNQLFSIMTKWGSPVGDVKRDMDKYSLLPSTEESILSYEILKDEMTVLFKFTESALSSSCIYILSTDESLGALIKDYEYLGDIDLTSIYRHSDSNTMAAVWTDETTDTYATIYGFTPIESDYFTYDSSASDDEGGSFISSGAADLGLPIKWAACNLGASSPEEAGDYYAWAETETKSDFSWATYKWYNATKDKITKYASSKTLSLEDDVANKVLGGKWRMPDTGDVVVLRNHCSIRPATYKGVDGYLVTSDINGNSIFFPSVGHYKGTEFEESRCTFWTKTTAGSRWANYAYLVDYGAGLYYAEYWRCYGFQIRPVMD